MNNSETHIHNRKRPVIALIGSSKIDTLSKQISAEFLEEIAKKIGAAFARNQFDLLVFSSDTKFIAGYIVEGYIKEGVANSHCIIDASSTEFPTEYAEIYGQSTYSKVFIRHPDPDPDWEVGFFKSLRNNADGIIIIGGGSSAIAAGVHCISSNLPIFCVAKFGGAAKTIWKYLLSSKTELLEHDEILSMGDWSDSTLAKIIESLKRQMQKRENVRQQAIVNNEKPFHSFVSIFITCLFGLSFALNLGYNASNSNTPIFYIGFIFSLLLGGSAGSSIRQLLAFHTKRPAIPFWRSIALGLASGLIIGCCYALPHMMTLPSLKVPEVVESVHYSLLFVPPLLAFSAGLGFDYVLSKLEASADNKAAIAVSLMG